MSIIKYIIYLTFIYSIYTQNNFPTWPMTGHDSISIHKTNEIGNTNTSKASTTSQQINTPEIMTNGSITVNTTNMSPDCNLECYTGCRVLFPEFIEQKYCIINVCKCQIIEKAETTPVTINNITNNSSMKIMNSNMDINKYSSVAYLSLDNKNLNFEFKNEKNNFYWIFYLMILIFSLGYEYYIWNYISEKNEFSLTNWLTEKNDTKFKKYRLVNGNEYENSNDNNDDELRRCLL